MRLGESQDPGFWPNETTGLLRPAVMAYLAGESLSVEDIAALRAYLRQWIEAPWGLSPGIVDLRRRVDALTSRQAIDAWLDDAIGEGIDPL